MNGHFCYTDDFFIRLCINNIARVKKNYEP